jgi:transcriptional regulator with XRE-family HTH domain
MDDLVFSRNLNSYMKNEGLSIKELALRLNVPLSTVHGWLNGVEPKSIKELKKVASLLGVSLDQLCYGQPAQLIPTNIQVTIGPDNFKIVLSKISLGNEK